MKKFLEKLKQNNLLLDGANVVAGIVMMAAFVLFIRSEEHTSELQSH